MKRKFVINLAFLLSLNMLIKPIYAFGIDVGVQNVVGALNYGNYFVLLNFALIFQILLDLGIENYNRREIARNPNLLKKYVARILPIKLVLGLFYFIACFGIGWLLGWIKHDFGLLALLLLNQLLANFILYFRSNMGGLHLFKLESLVSVMDKLIVILICGFLLINPWTHANFRMEWLVYTQTIAYSMVALFCLFVVLSRTGRIYLSFNTNYILFMLKRSLPYAMLIMLMSIYLRSSSVLLGVMHPKGKELAGIYAQSFRIIEILSNYGFLFTAILLPLFSSMIKKNESVAALLKLSFKLLFVPGIILVGGSLAYRSEIIALLYNEHTGISEKIFAILIGSFLGMCTTYIFGTLLTANGSLRQLNIMAGITVVLNLVLNALLIPRYGVYGAAITHLITQLFTSIYHVILSVRVFSFRPDYNLIIRFMVFFAVVFIGAFLFHQFQMGWVISFTLFLAFALSLSLLTRLLQLKSIKLLLQKGEVET